MDWTERNQGEFSTFEAMGRFTIEPEDLDIDMWSLWDGRKHVFDGTREECEAKAQSLI